MLPEARLELADAIELAVPPGTQVNAYPLRSGKKSRFNASVTVGSLSRGLDDTHQMIEAELTIEAPASAGIDIAYDQIDLLQTIVDEALPINWLKIPGWDVVEETDPIPCVVATAMVLGNPAVLEPPLPPDYILLADGDRLVISFMPLDLVRIS